VTLSSDSTAVGFAFVQHSASFDPLLSPYRLREQATKPSIACDTSNTYNSALNGPRVRQHAAAVAFGHDGIPKGLACVPVSTAK